MFVHHSRSRLPLFTEVLLDLYDQGLALVFVVVNQIGRPRACRCVFSYQNFTRRGLKPALAVAASAVERLQDALGVSEYRGDFHVYGPETVEAVEGFQQAHGLQVTGCADPATRQAVGLDDAEHDYTLRAGDADHAEDFTPHGFRHTCVSLVVGAGANVKLAQRFAGHASASMTLDTYSHLFDDNLEGVADALGRLVDEAQGVENSRQRALSA